MRLIVFSLCFVVAARAEMPRYETRYYVLYTDIPREQAQEVALRMSKMAEEYRDRTRDFSGAVRSKFPFYLYQKRDDYIAAGGLAGTDGEFNGTAMFAVAGERLTDRTWHVVQHEGFHQFAAAVIGGERPMWINEGLAEYFGEALFTGDGFVSGIIPNWRLKRLRDEIKNDKLLSVEQMMNLGSASWNADIKIANYDQAWSMTHFLAHGENGKYQKAFSAMMSALSHGKPAPTAWNDNFGSATGFEQRWKAYWLELPDDPTADLYAQATTARLGAFLARAATQKQTFASYEAFHTAALTGKLKTSPADWLPMDLLMVAIADADDLITQNARFTVSNKPSSQIECLLPNGTQTVTTWQVRGTQMANIATRIQRNANFNQPRPRP